MTNHKCGSKLLLVPKVRVKQGLVVSPSQQPATPDLRNTGGRPLGRRDDESSVRKQLAESKRNVKADARRRLVELVVKKLEPIVQAQMDLAVGLQVLMVKDDNGVWKRVTDPAVIEAVMNSGKQGDYWKISAIDPDVQAAKYLIDQTIDKATEHQEISGDDGQPLVVRWER